MPRHPFARPQGRLVEETLRSDHLADNLLGDPDERSVAVYLPPDYDGSSDAYPVLVDLVGFTGSGFSHLGWKAYQESVPQRLDRLVAEGRMGPVIAVFPDCFTSLGGNQYVNSIAMGRWADFLIEDVLPWVETTFRARGGPAHRAVFGKSSGGYGAIAHGLLHGEHWGALACHSGDMGFPLLVGHELPRTLDLLAKHGGLEPFLEHVRGAPKLQNNELMTLMILTYGATYDPDPSCPQGIRLPLDLRTGALDRQRWAAWLAYDPVEILDRPDAQAHLRGLRGLYIDCGSRDQHFLHYGAPQFVEGLIALGIDHRYEEFDDDHTGIDYRMDISLPFLYDALTGGG